MGLQPVNKGEDFVASRMTLITERASDKWLELGKLRRKQAEGGLDVEHESGDEGAQHPSV